MQTSIRLAIALYMASSIGLISCGGGAAATTTTTTTTAAISVSVTANPPGLAPGQTSQLTAVVSNDVNAAGVTWALASGAPGTLTTVDALHATYTAPASVAQNTSVVVTATSVKDSTKSASVTLNLAVPISVSVAAKPANLGLNQTSTLTATVSADPANKGVTWALASGAPGTLTSTDSFHATYTSPATLAQITNVQVTATSVADTTKSGSATLSVNPAVQVTVSANATSLSALQGALLTATGLNDNGLGVSWSLQAGAQGTITPIDLYHAAYTAPENIAASATDTVTATSLADNTKTATQAMTLNPLAAGSLPPWQNLVAFQNGLAYEGTTNPPYAALETAKGSGVFQGNALIFHDTQTGTEIWRLNNDPNADTGEVGTLNRQAWDANGSHLEVWSDRCVPESFCGDQHNFIYAGDGSSVSMVLPVDPTRSNGNQNLLYYAHGEYMPWDRNQPGQMYMTTDNDTTQATAGTFSSLYRVDALHGYTVTKIADLPNNGYTSNGTTTYPTKGIQSYPANDDTIMVRDSNASCTNTNDSGDATTPCLAPATYTYMPNVYMVNPGTGQVTTFPLNFGGNLPAAFASLTNHFVGNEYHVHDIYFRRSNNDDFIFNYGPLGSVGEPVFFEAPESGDGAQVTVAYQGPCPTPGGTPYYSHPAWNFDGSLVAYDGESTCGSGDFATHVRNQNTGQVVNTIGQSNGGHLGWDGYDPNYIVFDGDIGSPDPTTGLSVNAYFSSNPTVSSNGRVLVYRQPRNEQTSPSLLYGPVQSPDATKVLFALPEQWVNNSPLRTYIAVDHRPIAPALAASSSGSNVVLTWTPYLTAREVAGYRVYRSPQGAKAFQEIDGGLIAGTTFTDTTATSGQTYDYAVTAQENSGLESNQLSNIEEVVVGGAASQSAAAGTTGWWTTPPNPPTGLSAKLDASGTFLTLSWTASTSSDVRYYKIYYGDGSKPAADQAHLIATPPGSASSWIIWQVDANVPPVFGVSAVDRQDNESTMACLQTANPTKPCQ